MRKTQTYYILYELPIFIGLFLLEVQKNIFNFFPLSNYKTAEPELRGCCFFFKKKTLGSQNLPVVSESP